MNIEQELELIGMTTEKYEAFLDDCCDKVNKISDMEWQEIIDKYGLDISVERLRKAQAIRPFGGAFVREFMLNQNKNQLRVVSNKEETPTEQVEGPDLLEQLAQKERDIYIAKRKLQDERTELNKKLREHARLEENERLLFSQLTSLAKERYPELNMTRPVSYKKNTVVVCLSDLHIGAGWDNSIGTFDTDIAKERLGQYLNEIKKIQGLYEANKCIVCLLGDCINGNIHKTVAISNREDVIEQTKLACELVTDFIYNLSNLFDAVEVHSVSGNHSRIEAKKEDALLAERLDNLIPWFANHMLKHCNNIKVCLYEPDDTVSRFEIGTNIYFMVHGDFDSMNASDIENLSMFMGEIPYAVLMGHKHFPAMTTVSGIHVVQCGSLCGSGDEFTRKKRLFGEPSQTVLVCNEKGIVAMHPVNLAY